MRSTRMITAVARIERQHQAEDEVHFPGQAQVGGYESRLGEGGHKPARPGNFGIAEQPFLAFALAGAGAAAGQRGHVQTQVPI